MDNTRILEIILRARDEASKTLDRAGSSVTGFNKLVKDHYKEAGAAAGGLIASIGLITKSAVENAASYEQNRIAFESMLGSADKARKLLAQVSDFAAKTPFELPQVVAAARQLVAYGFAQQDVIKTTKLLGDISSGVGAPLEDLVYLYGTLRAQNVAYTKDLNQFTARGIPVLDLLAKKFNVTKEEVLEMASQSKISFKDIEAVFGTMTSKGGLFFNGMERQSKSFSGVMSNLNDSFGKFVREVVGINDRGDIREGSLFAALKDGAERLLVVMEEVRPKVTAMVNAFSQNETAIAALAGAIGGLLVLAIGAAVIAFGPAIAVMLAFAAAGATIAGTVTYLNTTFDLFKTKQDMITEAQRVAKDAVDAHWQAVRNLDDAIKGLTNAELNLEGAQLRYERAQRTLADVTRQYGANTLEAKEARHNLKRAEDDVATAMAEVNKKMDEAQKKYDEGIKKADEAVVAQDNIAAAVNRQRTAWDSVKEAIQGALNKVREWDILGKSGPGGAGASALLSNLPRFADGGWVPNTGLAVVHQGEYVLSRDMLAGRQPIEAPITNNRNSNITMNNHFHTDVSPDQLIRQLSFALKFDSTI
jgi:hypothetical protein